MSANLPAAFNQQFFAPAVEGVAMVAAGYHLHAYLTGTTTAHNTFTAPDGVTPNANPIVLNDDGYCTFYLDPAVLYTLVLKDAADAATVDTWNNVGAAALTTGTVVSINGLTGVVVLDASGVPYVTSSSATWLTADNVESALDQIADRANSPPASSVTLSDAGGFFTGSEDVEDALQILGAKSVGTKLLRITPFLTSGTWTKGTDVGSVNVIMVGGGGGSNASTVGSGGGGGGGYSEKFVATPGATEAVTVGPAGAIGGAGGASSFGAWATATGGSAGGTTIGGNGGIGSGGDINLRGDGGDWGAATSGLFLFGKGGSSHLGGGARGNVGGGSGSGAAQAADANSGGGGSGGTSGGATGGSGVVYVYEYSK